MSRATDYIESGKETNPQKRPEYNPGLFIRYKRVFTLQITYHGRGVRHLQ